MAQERPLWTCYSNMASCGTIAFTYHFNTVGLHISDVCKLADPPLRSGLSSNINWFDKFVLSWEFSVTYNVLAIEGSGPIDPIPLTLCFPAGSLSAV